MPAPRRWVKLFCYERLHGSVVFQLSESEQSIWDKLLCLAGLCGHDGLIADHDRRPYPPDFIIHELHTTAALYNSTIVKCKSEGRITEDDEGIKIANWSKYQSEYSRQKPYRERGRSYGAVSSAAELELINKLRRDDITRDQYNDEMSKLGGASENSQS